MFTPPVTRGPGNRRLCPECRPSPVPRSRSAGAAIGVDKACRAATRPRRGACAAHLGLAGSSTAARNAAMASATASGTRLGR
jgi:hypothetical protein